MFGANIIYLSNQRTEGNKYGTYFTAGSTAETNLTGVAYSNTLPDFEKFKKLIGARTNFKAVERFQLGASDSDVSDEKVDKPFTIRNITNDNGVILIDGELKTEKIVFSFQVVNFDNSSFSIAYKYKGDAYNFTIAI